MTKHKLYTHNQVLLLSKQKPLLKRNNKQKNEWEVTGNL